MRAGVLVVVVAAAAVTMSGCSVANTEPDTVGLHYDEGPFSATRYQNCIPAGAQQYDGPSDGHYYYPSGQRTYEFSSAADADSPVITVSTSDNVEMKVSGVLTFTLTGDCALLRKFHEQIGLKYKAYAVDAKKRSPGWNKMLSVYLRQPLLRAMNEATQTLTWKKLYNEPATKRQWENEVNRLLPGYVKQQAGDDYFTGVSITIQKPDLPAQIIDALQDEQAAIAQANAQRQRNLAVRTEAESIKELVSLLGPQGYTDYTRNKLLAQAIASGKVSVVPLPEGGSSTVLTPGR